MDALLLLAVGAGMAAAANPCGFALLPAYLSVLVVGDNEARNPIGRAIWSTVALTAGFTAVFGAFGLLLAPLTGWLMPRLPWVTVGLGVVLLALGGWVAAGRHLPGVRSAGRAAHAPAPSFGAGSFGGLALFGVGYAAASLSCTITPFLALVVASVRAGSPAHASLLFVAYAVGMGLVVGVTAMTVAVLKASVLRRLRRATAALHRLSGVLLALSGGYVAYYGWYEVRVVADHRTAGNDLLVEAAGGLQTRIVALFDRLGPLPFALALFALFLIGIGAGRLPAFDRRGGEQERRLGFTDRRVGAIDRRVWAVERRSGGDDRRGGNDRRAEGSFSGPSPLPAAGRAGRR